MRVLLLIAILLFSLPAKSEARVFAPAELEGLLAPIALQPDPVLWNVLEASTTPQEVMDAAAGRGARTPAVEALLPYPDLLERMTESPQWLFDLGNAYLGQREGVLAAVQVLRQRAGATGYQVNPSYVTHYNPIIVYGAAWRPAYHVHYWRPWTPRPVIVHRPIVHKPIVHKHVVVPPRRSVTVPDRRNGAPSVAAQMQRQQAAQFRQNHRIPESKRQPIVRPWGQAPSVQHGGHAHRGSRR
jgi:hypothetical protein